MTTKLRSLFLRALLPCVGFPSLLKHTELRPVRSRTPRARCQRGSGRQQRTFRRDLLNGPRRHIREEKAKSLRHRRMRENGVAEP